MDAHHAAEPTKRTASPASSSSAQPNASAAITTSHPTTTTKVDKPKLHASGSMHLNQKSTASPTPPLVRKNESKSGAASASATSTPHSHDHHVNDDEHTADNNSEAETIVLSGKDGSPIKSRKVIKREDSDGDGGRGSIPEESQPKRRPTPNTVPTSTTTDTKQESSASGPLREGSHGINAAGAGATKPSVDPAKRKRLVDHPQSSSKDSSALSSAPGTPLVHPSRRRRSADNHPGNDSDSVHAKPAKTSSSTSSNRPPKDARDHESRDRERERARDKDKDKDKDGVKVKTGDRVVSHKRKVPRNESDDEADPEAHKARRQRTSQSIDASSSRPRQKDPDHPKVTAIKSTHDSTSARHRSTSPLRTTHRRSASTQVTASHSSGLSHKKKRIPPPIPTDYQSDASSGSGSPHPRASTARGLATPATADSIMSSAKSAHKKHTDAHGQTPLAKACSRGELDNVKKRLAERPDDLDFQDYAGNAPLQIAALYGHDKIVDFLIKQNCNIECMNHDKDTPLLDAVENGHLEVVKILLDAGVNPRKANGRGEEPLELVTEKMDDAEELRDALLKAKEKAADLRRASTEDPQNDPDAHSPNSADSGHRRSPSYPEPSSSRRAASSRSHKMSNKVLYMPLDVKALREAAGNGDEEIVHQILSSNAGTHNDAQSMVAAAKGGHDGVINLLLAIGECNSDPPVVRSGKDEDHSTPILAAIGQENVEVIKLLVCQATFDPTRRYNGETYYEIARKRAGPSWKDEETILKNAYDEYRKSHRDATKKSPANRRDEAKRAGRAEGKDDSGKPSKRKATSPSRERASSKVKSGDRESKGTDSQGLKSDEPVSPKRSLGKKKGANMPSIAISDVEASPRAPKSPKAKRSDPDAAAISSDGEAVPRKRKKLVTRKEMLESAGRRGSVVSNSSSLREPSSPGDTRHDEVPTEKYHDRAKSIKEDESRDKPRDKLSVSDHSAKRSRTSSTPDHGASEKEGEPVKKRRLDVDKKDRASKASASPDRNRKSASSRDASGSSKHEDKPGRKQGDQAEKRAPSKPRKPDSVSDQTRRDAGSKSTSSDKGSIHVNLKGEDSDAAVRDTDSIHGDDAKIRAKEDEKKRRAELEAKRKQKEKEAEDRKSREEEQRRQAEIKKQEESEKEKKRLLDEERKKQEDEARKKREAEEAQRKAKEELEKRQAEEARILREQQEQERIKKEEEERSRKEKEAAEEARRKREEEQRKEQQERLAREEMRRREILERRERERLERLPASLRWLERSADAKTPDMAQRWRMLRGVRYDSIDAESVGTPEGREQWVLNTQVAMLIGESDIKLTRFPQWKHVSASQPAKHLVMGLARPKPGLTASDEWELGKQLPDYYLGKEPDQLTKEERRHLEEESKAKFLALDLFFVKLLDLMSVIPTIPHLRSLEIVVTYHEAAETLEQHDNGDLPSRWKDDPDAARYKGYCPRSKYYVNGELKREGQVDISSASYKPWPENRVPRDGLMAVQPTDPNYARLAKEQGLEHLLSGLRTPPLTIAAQTSPNRLFSQRTFGDLSPPQSESTATANGDGHHQPRSSTSSTAEQDRPLVNGHAAPVPAVNGTDAAT